MGPLPQCRRGEMYKARLPGGYLAKSVAMERGYGTEDCPWLIQGQPGQTINVTLYDFR